MSYWYLSLAHFLHSGDTLKSWNARDRGHETPLFEPLWVGRAWRTADYVPGACAPPNNPAVVHTISVELEHPETWGHVVGYGRQDAKKPTGLYLAPGQVANVTVPRAVVDAGGFKVLCGAQTHDNAPKSMHMRMDRVSVSFPIEATSTLIASPLGGGIYILVPYRAALGVVSIDVTGGVVPAPFFRRTAFEQMSNTAWAARRTAAVPARHRARACRPPSTPPGADTGAV